MATLTGYNQAFESDTTTVDSSAKTKLFTRAFDSLGNEYIYLLGVANTEAGSWVSWNATTGQTALLAGNAVGEVGIAMAAIVASKYGWYQIFGYNTIAKTDTVAANKQLYIDGTAGRADDANVAGDLIVGALSITADTSNVATVRLVYPHVTDVLGS
jgi:hypothetical protein